MAAAAACGAEGHLSDDKLVDSLFSHLPLLREDASDEENAYAFKKNVKVVLNNISHPSIATDNSATFFKQLHSNYNHLHPKINFKYARSYSPPVPGLVTLAPVYEGLLKIDNYDKSEKTEIYEIEHIFKDELKNKSEKEIFDICVSLMIIYTEDLIKAAYHDDENVKLVRISKGRKKAGPKVRSGYISYDSYNVKDIKATRRAMMVHYNRLFDRSLRSHIGKFKDGTDDKYVISGKDAPIPANKLMTLLSMWKSDSVTNRSFAVFHEFNEGSKLTPERPASAPSLKVFAAVKTSAKDWYKTQNVIPLGWTRHIGLLQYNSEDQSISIWEPNRDYLQFRHIQLEGEDCDLAARVNAPLGWCQTWTTFYLEAAIFCGTNEENVNPARDLFDAFRDKDDEKRNSALHDEIVGVFGKDCPLTSIVRCLALRYSWIAKQITELPENMTEEFLTTGDAQPIWEFKIDGEDFMLM